MSEIKDDGGCAFPYVPHTPNSEYVLEYDPGMSLRDWFAGMAMMGIYANASSRIFKQEEIASDAYRAADLMLEVRNL